MNDTSIFNRDLVKSLISLLKKFYENCIVRGNPLLLQPVSLRIFDHLKVF
jgi:hypothetical protein